MFSASLSIIAMVWASHNISILGCNYVIPKNCRYFNVSTISVILNSAVR